MFEPTTFISTKWLKPLWNKLKSIEKDRNTVIQAIGDTFGNPVDLARYYVEPKCQHHNPSDYNEDDPVSYVSAPVFNTINSFLNGEFALRGDGRTQMFILSDAGMGKTSLLVMLKLAHTTSFWPLNYNCTLLKLGPRTIEDIESCENQANKVLLLDALDEDPCAWGNFRDRLLEILTATVNFKRVIISCRNQFFPEDSTDSFGLPGRVTVGPFVCPTIYLSYFDDTQVQEYLGKRYPGTLIDKLFRTTGNDQELQKGVFVSLTTVYRNSCWLTHCVSLACV